VITLAPTVTLWDAGEFITASKVLGIPHPPGTPLFVLLGHIWAGALPIGGYAWRLNLMSACFSAAGAGCYFLVAHRVLAGEPAWLRTGAAAAAALLSAFVFTHWQNSNETEVYTVATFSIAAMAWLVVRWRDLRASGDARAIHLLLLIVYIAALSIGNHLLALLAGPAVSVFIAQTLRTTPAVASGDRQMEWAEWAVLTTLWIVLIAVGLGSTKLLIVGGVFLLSSVVFCIMNGSTAFAILATVMAAVGISIYAFLYIRSGLQPLLNEAAPDNWTNLLAVIRREQFGSRGLFANPMVPGRFRTPAVFGEQFVNFLQYCSWQWARAWPAIPMVAVSLVFVTLGTIGFDGARRRDAGLAWLLGVLWLVTGVGLVLYMNFKAGFSLFWDKYPSIEQHEVRERDYFFAVSFQTWGVFAALGLAHVVGRLAAQRRAAVGIAVGIVVTLLPFGANFTAASRRHGADAYAARDFAYNLLQSVEPYGVLFGFGDNDTFPVWYLQEVEGVRQDVTLINLSLANLDWYLRQLAQRPIRPFDPARAPAIYRALAPPQPPSGSPLPLSEQDIRGMQPVQLRDDGVFRAGTFELPVRKGEVLRTADQVILYTIALSLPNHRPVTFGVSSGRGSWLGLDPQLVYQGLVFKVEPGADTTRRYVRGVQGPMVDSARTRLLVDSVFEWGKMFETPDSLELEPAAEQVAHSFAVPFLELGNAAAVRGDQRQALEYFRRGYHLNPSPALADILRRLQTEGVKGLFRR
jgi:hypothetical protein